jgi:hypothetical protein
MPEPPQGTQGARENIGLTGATGPAGPIGAQGPIGLTGAIQAGSVKRMLEDDFFIKEEINKMFIKSFRNQTILISVCCFITITVFILYSNWATRMDIKVLKEIKIERELLRSEREALQYTIDSISSLKYP